MGVPTVAPNATAADESLKLALQSMIMFDENLRNMSDKLNSLGERIEKLYSSDDGSCRRKSALHTTTASPIPKTRPCKEEGSHQSWPPSKSARVAWRQDIRDVKSGFGIDPPAPKGEPRVSSLSPLLLQPRLNKIQENLDCIVKQRQCYSKETALTLFKGTNPDDHIQYIKRVLKVLRRICKTPIKERNKLEGYIERNLLQLEGKVSRLMQRLYQLYKVTNNLKQVEEKRQAVLESAAATTIFCWWRRNQLRCYFEKQQAARIIQLWNRRRMLSIRCKALHAATTIQRWRRSLVNRRKEDKLAEAALSSPLRDRGQPLHQLSRRTRHRHKLRAERQCNSKRYRSKRKRGQRRGRPPNPTQPQQSQQQSIKRRENTLGIALSNNGRSSIRGSVIGSVHSNSSELNKAGPYVLGRDFRRRDSNGRVTVLGTALQPSGLSSRENVIGTTLQDNESSSRGNTAEIPQQDSSKSHCSFTTQPISSLTCKSRRRRRRRRRRRKQPRTIHRQKDGAPTSQRHTPTYPSSNAHLSNISDFCDGIRRQLHQASPSDRNLLKFVCQLVLQTVDNQPIEPSPIDKIESISTSPTVDNPSSTTNIESLSSINIVDSNNPKSTTTKLTELSSSANTNTEELTTRREKPFTYMQALIGTTSNCG